MPNFAPKYDLSSQKVALYPHFRSVCEGSSNFASQFEKKHEYE